MKLLTIIVLLLLIPEVSALTITEFMPNPEGPDEDLEWIELYNNLNSSININGFYLNNKQLPDLQINPKETIVLARQLLDKDSDNYSFEKQYGNKNNLWDENLTALEFTFSLGNTNGIINLSNPIYTELINYGTSSEGFSFIREILNGSFTISVIENGEPGKNSFDSTEEPIENKTINQTNSTLPNILLEIIEFMPNPEGPDNDKPPKGEWIKIKNLGDTLNLENFYFEDSSNGKLFIKKDNIEGDIIFNQNEIIKIYRNGLDSFSLNNNEDTIKLKFNNTLFDSVSYTSTLEDISWKKINNSWILNKEDELQNEEDVENYIRIEKVYGKLIFDNILYVKLNIYYKKEINEDNDITVYVENITEKLKLQLYSKNINYSLLLPLKIKSNCNNEFNEGNYFVIASGISTFDKKRIFVESNEKCESNTNTLKKEDYKIKTETTINSLKPEFTEERESIINEPKIVYSSNENKIQSYAIILFIVLLILIFGAMIYGKWENTHKDNTGSSWVPKRPRREDYRYDFGQHKE